MWKIYIRPSTNMWTKGCQNFKEITSNTSNPHHVKFIRVAMYRVLAIGFFYQLLTPKKQLASNIVHTMYSSPTIISYILPVAY